MRRLHHLTVVRGGLRDREGERRVNRKWNYIAFNELGQPSIGIGIDLKEVTEQLRRIEEGEGPFKGMMLWTTKPVGEGN